jgi:hypothetical protein
LLQLLLKLLSSLIGSIKGVLKHTVVSSSTICVSSSMQVVCQHA